MHRLFVFPLSGCLIQVFVFYSLYFYLQEDEVEGGTMVRSDNSTMKSLG
jgi:hypothetical protein